MNIFLVRHGEIRGAEVKRFIGTTDVPLSDRGIEQARLLRCYLSAIFFDRVYSSPLERTLATASIISGLPGEEIIEKKALGEIDLGQWDGKSFSKIQRLFPREWIRRGEAITTYRPPLGESFSDLQARVVPCFEEIIAHTFSNILIAGHAGVNRVLLCYLQNRGLDRLFSIPQEYGAVNIIKAERGKAAIKAVNLLPLPDHGCRRP
ncbi:MAG: histidine phosphatase family protein [Desulfobacteraceae bacterium]